ncbi:MAG: RNA methyltransferase [Acidimicrobiia bacterium]|nr:RNA methyltransferase [Acidimicrobiia bacterium]
MTVEPVVSPRNPRIVAAARLHRARDRHSAGRTIIEGPHVLAEAIAGEVPVHEVFALETDRETAQLVATTTALAGATITIVGEAALARVSGTEHPRGPVAVIEVPAPVPPRRDVILLAVNDPGNAGTLIRSAAAFGFDVASIRGAVDLWAPKVLRSAAGGHFRTAIVTAEAVASHQTIVTVAAGGRPVADVGVMIDLEQPVVVVVGNEAHGVSGAVRRSADAAVSIPMVAGIESLNAAVAGSIALYEIASARGRRSDA